MPIDKPIKNVLALSFICIITASQAATIRSNNAFNYQHSTNMKHQMMLNKQPSDRLNNSIKQPTIATSVIAGISKQKAQNKFNGEVVYVLAKKKINSLGGSAYQNKAIKQYLGKHYEK